MRTLAAATSARPATSSVMRKTQFDRKSSGTASARRTAGIASNIIVIGAHRIVNRNGAPNVSRAAGSSRSHSADRSARTLPPRQAGRRSVPVQHAAPDGDRYETAESRDAPARGRPTWPATGFGRVTLCEDAGCSDHTIESAIQADVARDGYDEDKDGRDCSLGRKRRMLASPISHRSSPTNHAGGTQRSHRASDANAPAVPGNRADQRQHRTSAPMRTLLTAPENARTRACSANSEEQAVNGHHCQRGEQAGAQARHAEGHRRREHRSRLQRAYHRERGEWQQREMRAGDEQPARTAATMRAWRRKWSGATAAPPSGFESPSGQERENDPRAATAPATNHIGTAMRNAWSAISSCA